VNKKLPLGWRRRPLPVCPMCGGKGSIMLDVCGARVPLRGPCACVQMDRPRGDDFRKRLQKMAQQMGFQ
jgi:hypothetical protein